MKRWYAVAVVWFVALALSACTHRLPQQGWTTLIDGEKGLENFDRLGDANWRAEDGAIVANKGKGGYLVSKKSYKDFDLYAEFWADHTTNSGIFIRNTDPKKISAVTGYEVNIFDQRPSPEYGTGGIPNYAMVTLNPAPKAGGKWNVYEISARGSEVTVKLNGQVTVHMRDGKNPSGPFALQYGGVANNTGGGAIKWRKVEIREP